MSLKVPIFLNERQMAIMGFTFVSCEVVVFVIYFCYKKSKKSKKRKKFITFLIEKKPYFFKTWVFLVVFFPRRIFLIFSLLKAIFLYFSQFYVFGAQFFINYNIFYNLGFITFKLFLLPLVRVVLVVFNFLINFNLFNNFFIFQIFLQAYVLFWSSFGFYNGFKKNLSISVYSLLKRVVLEFLILLNYTVLLIFLFFFDRNNFHIIKLKTFKSFSINVNLPFLISKVKENYFILQVKKFNDLPTLSLKVHFFSDRLINSFYFFTIWYLRMSWFLQLLKFSRTVFYLQPVQKLLYKGKASL